jgi:hypothetical protein
MRQLHTAIFLLIAYESCLTFPSATEDVKGKNSIIETSPNNSLAEIDSSHCEIVDSLGIHLKPDSEAKFGDSPEALIKFISELDLELLMPADVNSPELLVTMKVIVSNIGKASIVEINGKSKLSCLDWELELIELFESSKMWKPAKCQKESVSSYLPIKFRLRLR